MNTFTFLGFLIFLKFSPLRTEKLILMFFLRKLTKINLQNISLKKRNDLNETGLMSSMVS